LLVVNEKLKIAFPKDAQREVLNAILLLAFAFVAGKAGFNGRPRTVASSLFWPFYVDTWFIPADRWSWRAILPLGAMAAMLPLWKRYLRDGKMLLGLVIAAWAYHLMVGFVRHGVVEGLTFTFHRPQEYWWDVPAVVPGFLAKFPDMRLSQHGGTHPPGVILFLALVQKLGVTHMAWAELVCTPIAALGALPVFGAAKRLTDDETARWAVVLYLFGCSITAFAVLSMDMLVVLLGAIAFYGFVRALDGEIVGGIICGLFLGAASLCSFLSLTLPLTWLILLVKRKKPIAALAASLAAFVAFYGFLVVVFGYRPIHVLQACMNALAHSDDRTRSRALALLGNPIAFFGSLGIAFCGLALHALYTSFQKKDEVSWLVWAALAPVALNTALGLPRAELERIYMPFIPALAVACAAAARKWYARDPLWLTHVAAPLWVGQSILIECLYDTYW
jgi:hypothetical protein